MSIRRLIGKLCIVISFFFLPYAYAGLEKIYVLKEIDDDNIIIVTEAGNQLLLEKWNLRFSPLIFEGKYFFAEISPLWVTIHFDDRESIKWSIEKNLGNAIGKTSPSTSRPRDQCLKSSIREPSPFLGNGGETIILDDGTIWKEISYQYLYLYEYNPSVIVCRGEGKMILGEHIFQIIPLK